MDTALLELREFLECRWCKVNIPSTAARAEILDGSLYHLSIICSIAQSVGGIEKVKTNIITVNINLAAAVLAILVLRRIQCYSVLGILDRVSTGTRVPIGCVERPYSCNDMS